MNGGYGVIDAHTHVHPTRQALEAFFAGMEQPPPDRLGTPEEAIAYMDRAGIATTLVLPWVFARQEFERRLPAGEDPDGAAAERLKDEIAAAWSDYNAWAAELGRTYPGRFAAMCALDPVLLGEARTRAEIERGLARRARGLKVVPLFMKALPSDERMAVVWQEADRRRLPVVSQSGGRQPDNPAHPANFEPVLAAYPNCRIVLAHVGMGAEEEVVRLANTYPNLFTDTSYWLGLVGQPGQFTPQQAADLFRRIGIDRVLFGTNYPICDSVQFVEILRDLPLSEAERRRIFRENARELYRL